MRPQVAENGVKDTTDEEDDEEEEDVSCIVEPSRLVISYVVVPHGLLSAVWWIKHGYSIELYGGITAGC